MTTRYEEESFQRFKYRRPPRKLFNLNEAIFSRCWPLPGIGENKRGSRVSERGGRTARPEIVKAEPAGFRGATGDNAVGVIGRGRGVVVVAIQPSSLGLIKGSRSCKLRARRVSFMETLPPGGRAERGINVFICNGRPVSLGAITARTR